MTYFKFDPRDVVDSSNFYANLNRPKEETLDDELEIHGISAKNSQASQEDELQFMIFQLNNRLEGKTVVLASEVEPELPGDSAQPDVYVNIEMQSFHLGKNEHVAPGAKATMRMIVGKDKSSSDKLFDNLFWTVSAGLDLHQQVKGGTSTNPSEFKADFTKAFGNRPIEIPGGLANLTFEVVKHKEPKWWQRIFGFLRSDSGRTLTSVVGFPSVTQSAINVLDELLNRLDKNQPEPLFKSKSMIFSLTQKAKTDYTAGSSRIKLGSINNGFCVFIRRKDYHVIANADAYFYPHFGVLVPSDVDPEFVASSNYDDPFKNITYAIFKISLIPGKMAFRYDSAAINA